MARTGRPRIEIDVEEFKKLCTMQATLEEIAGWFDCSADTIENFCKREFKTTFSDAFKRFSAGGKISLRRKQFHVAMDGNATMLIFLGKQYLGQSDKVDAVAHVENEIVDDPLSASLKEIAKGLSNGSQ